MALQCIRADNHSTRVLELIDYDKKLPRSFDAVSGAEGVKLK
jgi:hypothetical protein